MFFEINREISMVFYCHHLVDFSEVNHSRKSASDVLFQLRYILISFFKGKWKSSAEIILSLHQKCLH